MTVSQCSSCRSWTYYKIYFNDDEHDFRGKKIWHCSHSTLGSKSKAKKNECPGYYPIRGQETLLEMIE